MYKFICLFALVAMACAASIRKTDEETTPEKKEYEVIPVLKFENDHKPDGSFSFMYEGGDQSYRQETGVLENAGTDDEALEVTGSYRYIDADGHEVEVHYTAGRNGFVPYGTNILPEISTLAKAAADLPDNTVAEETRRQARSKSLEKDEEENIPVKIAKVAKVAVAEPKPKPTVPKVEKVQHVKEELIPVEIVKETKPVVAKVEKAKEEHVPVQKAKVGKIETTETKPTEEKAEDVPKVEEAPKVTKVEETKAKEETVEKPTKVEKAEKTKRSEETPKEDKTDKNEKSEKPEKVEKSKPVKTAPAPIVEEKKPAKKPTNPTKA